MDDEQGPWWTRPPEPDTHTEPAPPQQSPGRPATPPAPRRAETPSEEYPAHQATAPIPGLDPPAGDDLFDPTVIVPGPIPGTGEPGTGEPGTGDLVAEPEPAPEPPPKPKRPVVRRVAVVPPERPAPRARPDDRTETLPAVSDDIFATFSGPNAQRATPDEAPPARPERRRTRIDLPETRVLLLAGAAGLVALLIVIVALLTGGQESDPTQPTTAGRTTPPAANAVKDLVTVPSAKATELLQKAGQSDGGTVVEAWTWKDKNGENLVATTIAPAARNHRTLRVIHVAGLDGDPRTLRVMRDPGLPAGCKAAGTASFTPKSLVVNDLNGDDIAEVTAGWTSRCGGAGSPSVIKLALITNGDKYIIRGEGIVDDASSGTAVPAPRSSKWPDGFYKALQAQYKALYG